MGGNGAGGGGGLDPPPPPRISSVGHPIFCNVSLGGGTRIKKIITDQLLVKEKRGMGAQENRGRKGYGRREVWTPLYLDCRSSNPLHYNVRH